MNVRELIDAAMAKTGAKHLTALAAELGVSKVTMHQWYSGDRFPSFEHAAELAVKAGLDPVQTAADIRLQSPEGTKHRSLLRRLARAAMIATAALLPFALAVGAGDAKAGPGDFAQKSPTVMIMSRLARLLRYFGRRRHMTDYTPARAPTHEASAVLS